MDAKKFFVAGVQHHDLHKVINDIEEDDILELELEPTNKYDPNAVKILFGEVMIGYVPKKFSAQVSASLSIGPLECVVTKLDRKAKPWEQIEVTISELVEAEFEDDDEYKEEEGI